MRCLLRFVMFSVIAVMLSACQKPAPSVIDESRLTEVSVECHSFIDTVKTIKLKVLDVTADSVRKIFAELFHNNFPIHVAYSYENRPVLNAILPSLHAYGAAIDINEHMNPYYDMLKGPSSIDPKRFIDRDKDKEEITNYLKTTRGLVDEFELSATVNAITQEQGSDDWYVNREIYRKGMLTQKEAEIFAKNGFTMWGGKWKQPVDFMHFQIPRKLAEVLAATSKEEGEIIWKNHLLLNEWHLRLKKMLEGISKEQADVIWKEHLDKCQQDGGYLIAANKKDTTAICLADSQNKVNDIGAMLRKSFGHQHKTVLKKGKQRK